MLGLTFIDIFGHNYTLLHMHIGMFELIGIPIDILTHRGVVQEINLIILEVILAGHLIFRVSLKHFRL